MTTGGGGGFMRPARGGANPLAEYPALFDAALDAFSGKSFDEASLNDIIKASGISKGSFYYRFTDKQDLYLCLIDRIASDKLAYFAGRQGSRDFPEDFFEQLKALAAAGLEYARHEPRYYRFWRRFLAESGAVRLAVKAAFPDAGRDGLLEMVAAAKAGGQLRGDLPDGFIANALHLILNNLDTWINADTGEQEMLEMIGRLMSLLRDGLAAARAR